MVTKTILILLVAPLMSLSSVTAAEELVSTSVARIEAATWSYAVFATAVTLTKITALIIGYLVVKLGYTTMMAGVKGQDSVELGGFGAQFKFKGVTPGLALGIAGVLMMGWALSTKHQFSVRAEDFSSSLSSGVESSASINGKGTENGEKGIPKLFPRQKPGNSEENDPESETAGN